MLRSLWLAKTPYTAETLAIRSWPDSLSAMRKRLALLLGALLHRLDRGLAASYLESLAMRRQLAVPNRKTSPTTTASIRYLGRPEAAYPHHPPPRGLLLGYAAVPEAEIEPAVKILAQALRG